MKIKTTAQFTFMLAVVIVISVTIATCFVTISADITTKKTAISSDIIKFIHYQRITFDRYLRDLRNEYAIEWQALYEATAKLLQTKEFDSRAEQAILEDMREYNVDTQQTFAQIVALHERELLAPNQQQTIAHEREVLANHLFKLRDAITEDAYQLDAMAKKENIENLSSYRHFIMAVGGVFVVLIFVILFSLKVKIVNRLSKLNDGIQLIDSGNLEHKITIGGDDEISQLTKSFNDMMKRLQHSFADQSRLAAIVDNTLDAIISKDLDGTILSWNLGAQRMLGYSAAEMVGQSILLIIPPEIAANEIAIMERVRHGEVVKPYETKRRHQDGSQIEVSVMISPMRNVRGDIIGASKILRDITELKQTQEELRKSSLIQSLINGISDLVYIKDLHGRYLMLNTAYEQFTGQSAAETLGKDDRFLFTTDEAATIMAADRKVVDGSHLLTYEETLTNAHGQSSTFLSTKGMLFDESGKPLAIFGMARDISDRKRSEEALEQAKAAAEAANQAKTKFLATMSHDLRTPLNAIIGFSELLLTESPASSPRLDQRQSLQLIAKSGHHLLKLVEGLLSLSALESGRTILHKELIDLRVMLEELSDIYDHLAGQKEIQWRCDIRVTKPLCADRHRIWEVVNNLVSNALKYTPPQGMVTLGAYESASAVTIFVKDTGVGIEKDDFQRIFMPFEQGKSPGVSLQGGSVGLGLAISRQLVDLHKGTLTVESTKGEGSCFTVTLPYAGGTLAVVSSVGESLGHDNSKGRSFHAIL